MTTRTHIWLAASVSDEARPPALNASEDRDRARIGVQALIDDGLAAVARDTFLSLRDFSAQTISGPRDGNNVLQLDLQSGL